MKITTVGIDLAKNVIKLHGVNKQGKKVFNKQLQAKRVLSYFMQLPPCLIGMEAYGSAHFCSRKIQELGNTVKWIPEILEHGENELPEVFRQLHQRLG